ncbi:hypothetical protein [uncultured Sphingomonas sp.]|uniref:hypothetical protein n=1 Tax=uncultured Sphingomonas sp. TaxID=158754 RepID=UPI0030DC30F6
MTRPTDVPLSLMRMALALLDQRGEGDGHVAVHLRAAINARMGGKPLQAGDELDNEGQ